LLPAESIDQADDRMLGGTEPDAVLHARDADACRSRGSNVRKGRLIDWSLNQVRQPTHSADPLSPPTQPTHSAHPLGQTTQPRRAAVACDRHVAKASAWVTTSAPSATADTRTDRSSLLEVPVYP